MGIRITAPEEEATDKPVPKACPFCGGAPVVVSADTFFSDKLRVIKCQKCGASGPSYRYGEWQAIEAWNERA